MNESHTTHVGGELIYLIELRRRAVGDSECLLTVAEFTQIQDSEVVRRRGGELGVFDVNSTNPVPLGFEALYHMACDESPRTTDQSSFHDAILIFR